MISIIVSTLAVEWIEIPIPTRISGRCSTSPPSRWSGLKFMYSARQRLYLNVSTLAVEWIEMGYCISDGYPAMSPPSRWSGLKSGIGLDHSPSTFVSTLAVEWIEISCNLRIGQQEDVSTLAVEWIEICMLIFWRSFVDESPPSRWSGLKFAYRAKYGKVFRSPPSRWSGLKLLPFEYVKV